MIDLRALRALLAEIEAALNVDGRDGEETLVDRRRDALLGVLRNAYELGYRAALGEHPEAHRPADGVTERPPADGNLEHEYPTGDAFPRLAPPPDDLHDDAVITEPYNAIPPPDGESP